MRPGDRVRATSGAHAGEVGTVVRVVTARDEGRTSESVLVSFPGRGLDYVPAGDLEAVGGGGGERA